MPGRNFEDTNTHVMDISVMKMVYQHYSVYQNWGGAPPSGLLTTGMASFATSIIPPGLLVNTSAPSDGLCYVLPFITPGIAQSIDIIVTSATFPWLYNVQILQSGVIYSGGLIPGITHIIFTPTSTAPAFLFIQYTGFTPDNIVIDGVTLDSIVLTPMNVVSQIASDDQYHYGFNGKYKDNEWAGVGNHVDFGARGYDPRTCRMPAIDPMACRFPFQSPYIFAGNSPIANVDFEGLFRFNPNDPRNVTYGYKVSTKIFAAFLKNGIIQVLESEDIVRGLSTYGRASIERIKEELKWGGGSPEIILRERNDNDWGFTPPNSNPENTNYDSRYLYIDYRLVKQFQEAKPQDRQAALFNLVVTILHELTHYNDHAQATRLEYNEQDIGWWFESNVFHTNSTDDNNLQDLTRAKQFLFERELFFKSNKVFNWHLEGINDMKNKIKATEENGKLNERLPHDQRSEQRRLNRQNKRNRLQNFR